MDSVTLLHVFSQECPHDEAFLVGNREGLLDLWRALDRLLFQQDEGRYPPEETRRFAKAQCMTSDGEGFDLVVIRDDAPWAKGSRWYDRAVPYTHRAFVGSGQPGALDPWDEYRDLI